MAKFRIREIGTCWFEIEVEAPTKEEAWERYDAGEYSDKFDGCGCAYGDDFSTEIEEIKF